MTRLATTVTCGVGLSVAVFFITAIIMGAL